MDADTVIKKIKDVEIQGATNVARAGIELLQDLDEQGASQDELEATAHRLKEARPTEPFLFNAIDIVLETRDFGAVLQHIEDSQTEIHGSGADLINEGSAVYTHCHSSTVTGTLTRAFMEKEFSVKCTETRPLYQGRETAEELADAGIPVELSVDSGARLALEDADIMFIGADAVTPDGHVLNKIGSGMFAAVAQGHDVPVYVLTDSWKFDARTAWEDELETRPADEVWTEAPDAVDIVNYAFERVQSALIDGIVSELGVHPPGAFVDTVQEEYPQIADR